MEVPDQLQSLFSAAVEVDDGRFLVEVPSTEVEGGSVRAGEVYRVALLGRDRAAGPTRSDAAPPEGPQPPVERGEIRYVEVEDYGKQGDGIARVERGYVIIVPGAEVGERVKVEVTEVRPTFAVGEPIDESFD